MQGKGSLMTSGPFFTFCVEHALKEIDTRYVDNPKLFLAFRGAQG